MTDGSAGDRAPGAGEAFQELVRVMARLRAPGGCPWDRDQTHESLVRYLIEEAYEVVDAIEAGDAAALRDELGDLLLQVVFHAELAAESRRFDADDVCRAIVGKLVRRHPHVFGEESAHTPAEVENRWERVKAAEKRERGDASGVLDGVPRQLPALLKAQRLTEKAGTVGFDWPDAGAVLDKLREELDELEAARTEGSEAGVAEELGDLLFVVANLGRHLGVDAEAALQAANAKFTRRFHHVERRLREQGRSPVDAPLDEMDGLWEEAKRAERRERSGGASG